LDETGETFAGSGLTRARIEELKSPLACRVEVHEALGSTQTRARELAREGSEAATHGTLVTCGVQTGGLGRRGRSWGSPPGGIWMSLVLRPDLAAGHASRITQTAAVGVAKALWEFGVEARIKWPNDLLVDPDGSEGGRKICGILAESGVEHAPPAPERAGNTGHVQFIVLGIGLNANLDPGDLAVPDALAANVTTMSHELGGTVDLLRLLAAILSRLDYELSRISKDFGAVLDDWKSLDCTIGHRVRVQSLDGELEGRAVDLTPEGALIIQSTRGKTEVFEGDVQRLRRER
jgi:BirA family biotin operon repressor/biotin-[acetyl-CoA-carboxylase] ligase